MKKHIIIAGMCLWAFNALALDEIVVRANKLKAEVYDYIITAEDLKIEKAKSVAEVLNRLPGFNAISRGFSLIQTDLSANAGTLEQVSIIIDGVRVNDLQTGHYSLDIPLAMSDIEEIGVISNGSCAYGDGGFSGLVNIKTKKYDSDTLKTAVSYGSFGTFFSTLTMAKKLEDLTVAGTFEKSFSQGFHEDTGYDKNTAVLKFNYAGDYQIKTGYDEKDYGAYDFYTPGKGYPSKEYIITKTLEGSAFDKQDFGLSAYAKNHYDRFTLDNRVPKKNNRTTTGETGATGRYQFMIFETNPVRIKYNYQREEMQSSTMGNHYRDRNLMIINAAITSIETMYSGINLSVESYDLAKKYDVLPEINMSWEPYKLLKVYGGISYSKRYPNFTELYYKDNFNSGKVDLGPEKSAEYSFGMTNVFGSIRFNKSFFYKMSEDVIDWAAAVVTDMDGNTRNGWQIKNIGKINTTGITVDLSVDLKEAKLDLGYQYLDSKVSDTYVSKYGITYLRNKFTGGLDFYFLDITTRLNYFY